MFFTFTWQSFRPQIFNSYNQDVLVKLRRIVVLIVVVLSFHRHASENFKKLFLEAEPGDFLLHCLSLKYVVSDYFRWGSVSVIIKINWQCVFIFIKFAQATNHLKLSFFGLTSMWGLWKLFHPVKQWLKSFFETTDHLQQFRADKFSTFQEWSLYVLLV